MGSKISLEESFKVFSHFKSTTCTVREVGGPLNQFQCKAALISSHSNIVFIHDAENSVKMINEQGRLATICVSVEEMARRELSHYFQRFETAKSTSTFAIYGSTIEAIAPKLAEWLVVREVCRVLQRCS